MAQDLVRARLDGGIEKNVSRAFATTHKLEVLDEPTTNRDGSPRPATRAGGRPVKKKTSVAKQAAAKKAAVIEATPTDEEQNR